MSSLACEGRKGALNRKRDDQIWVGGEGDCGIDVNVIDYHEINALILAPPLPKDFLPKM